VVGCRTALIRGAGILGFLCRGDAFEFSICGGSFGFLEGLRISSGKLELFVS